MPFTCLPEDFDLPVAIGWYPPGKYPGVDEGLPSGATRYGL